MGKRGDVTIFEGCYTFEGNAKLVRIEETGRVIEKFYVLCVI